jgi:hypothetical protein
VDSVPALAVAGIGVVVDVVEDLPGVACDVFAGFVSFDDPDPILFNDRRWVTGEEVWLVRAWQHEFTF